MTFHDIDPVILARIQFAFTVSFHIVFPAFSIGLASWLAVVEGLWLKTKNPIYQEIYKFWVKIFAISFGMGVVSGIVLAYQFGTNWSVFSDKVGNVIGPLMGYEVLTAFFLEASFLGIMLFGWGRVSPRVHFTSTVIVAIGTLISAFWILAVNSWMQTPQGYEIREGGIMFPTSWIEIIFNPSFPYRLIHMTLAAYLSTAFVVGGVASWYLLKQRHLPHAKIMLTMAMIMAFFVAPTQLLVGDAHGLNTLEHQPAKVAAMEGLWETKKGVPLLLFAIPDKDAEKNHMEIAIPNMASLILTHDAQGELKGLKEWAKADRPPVAIVFWSFRIMVGLGMLMIATGLVAAFLYFRKRLFDSRWFHYWCMAMIPSGFIAVLAGWFVTEVGRQPYVVYNVLRTADVVSPVTVEQVMISLALLVVVYLFIFGWAVFYMVKLIRKGPQQVETADTYGVHGQVATPVIAEPNERT